MLHSAVPTGLADSHWQRSCIIGVCRGALEGFLYQLTGKEVVKVKFASRLAALLAALPAFALMVSRSAFCKPERIEKPRKAIEAPPQSQPDRRTCRGQYLARTALAFRGVRYVFGGTTRRGIDCSGLAQLVAKKWGFMLPRASNEQFKKGTPVKYADLIPGDLVFFKGTYKAGISHVGIYIGEHKFVHAADSKHGVIVSRLDAPYHSHHLAGARRLDLSGLPPSPQERIAAQRPSPMADGLAAAQGAL